MAENSGDINSGSDIGVVEGEMPAVKNQRIQVGLPVKW
jgi:hypothetical protein